MRPKSDPLKEWTNLLQLSHQKFGRKACFVKELCNSFPSFLHMALLFCYIGQSKLSVITTYMMLVTYTRPTLKVGHVYVCD